MQENGMLYAEDLDRELSSSTLEDLVRRALQPYLGVRRALLIHPDYTRSDFTHLLAPLMRRVLKEGGLMQLDTLNAGGTHRPMSQDELHTKLGFLSAEEGLTEKSYNHAFDDPAQLFEAGSISEEFVSAKTGGLLNQPLAVTANRLITAGYDLIIALSGTVPHEALGFSGGLKLLFPGISGPEVIGLLHWAAVLIGIPSIIGSLENPAKDVVSEGARHIFRCISSTPILSFNMLCSEKEQGVVPKGLYVGSGLAGFLEAHRLAAKGSSRIHIVRISSPLRCAVQNIHRSYDEIWTAGKGSYKLQRPGVMAEGGEIILYAPHISCFHSNPVMDQAIRSVGYHCRDWVVEFLKRNPDFDRNVAAHVINVRGPGVWKDGKEEFLFKISLASAIPPAECAAVGLGYRDPKEVAAMRWDENTFWIEEGGKLLYELERAPSSVTI